MDDIFGTILPPLRAIYHSAFFSMVEFILGIYTVVLLADIVLLFIQRGWVAGDMRDTIIGVNMPPELSTKKPQMRRKWDKITAGLKTDNESLWKVAIIEADNVIDDLIARMKYPGENMSERLDGINPGQIDNIEELRRAHEMRNRIIHDENFKLDKKQAEEIIGYYENFLRYFEVLE